MKCILLLPFLMAVVAAETYSTENDNLDIEEVVRDLTTLISFLDCFNDKKPCDEVQADFKNDMPEAFENACAKCTAAQKHIFKRFLEECEKKAPEDLKALKKKYDPESTHYAKLVAAISKS